MGAGDAAAHPSKFFLGKIDSIYRQIRLDLGKIWAKLRRSLGKTEAKFGQK